MIYAEVYKEGFLELETAGIGEAGLDARLLLEDICGTDRNTLLVHGGREVGEKELEAYRQGIRQRKNHIPLQYITGKQEFMGLEFKVNPNVLIPRQDTEILVEEVMRRMHDGMHLLDMCTGSGCVLLSLLHYSNGCSGLGSDLSAGALEVATENAERLGIRAEFRQSDLFGGIEGRFDILVSNPPYIPTGEIGNLMPEVRREPFTALDGMEDGLYFYRRMIQESPAYLNGGAFVLFEIGYNQGEAVKELMVSGGFREVEIIKDFAGLDRVAAGSFFGGIK